MNVARFGLKVKNSYGEWIYGRLERDLRGRLNLNFSTPQDSCEGYDAEADMKTLCQCTGVRDSDGNLIYENDYLRVKGMYKGEPVEYKKALVWYDEAMLTWLVKLDDHSEYLKDVVNSGLGNWECTVVGNKFD